MINKIKNIISFLLGIILMFTIVISVISIFLKGNFINEKVYKNILEKNEIYTKVNDSILNNISMLLSVNNLGAEVKDNVISVDEIKEEVDNVALGAIRYLNTGENNIVDIDKNKYTDRFKENLSNYISANGFFITTELQGQLDNVTEDVGDIIENEVELINVKVLKESSLIAKISKLTSAFSKGLYAAVLVLPIIISILLLIIWGRKYQSSTMWIGNGLIAGGLFVFIIFFSGYVSGFYNNVIINIAYLKELVANIIKHYLLTLSNLGLITTFIGVLLLIPSIRRSIKSSTRISKRIKGGL
ncbi:hypothetical protein [Clostridium sp.]|uniref:hypothetical protein n=1 Tax=Clostridium sp. TaxID=1506 RepID=UPI003F4048B1